MGKQFFESGRQHDPVRVPPVGLFLSAFITGNVGTCFHHSHVPGHMAEDVSAPAPFCRPPVDRDPVLFLQQTYRFLQILFTLTVTLTVFGYQNIRHLPQICQHLIMLPLCRQQSSLCVKAKQHQPVFNLPLPGLYPDRQLLCHAVYKSQTFLTDRTLLAGSILCGLTQFAAGSLQQIGIIYTTAGKAGFITSMHIVIVPILMIFLRRKVGFFTWIGVAVAVLGMYLLCITEGFDLQLGDGLVLGCAAVCALQILFIDHYAVRTDPIRLAALQFLLAGLLSGICMLGFEHLELAMILACAVPILYTGFLEVAAAYTLEIFGQQTTAPAVTAIILSLESVFAAICGALFLGEQMTGRELLGCALMLAAFLFTQLSDLIIKRRPSE